MPRGRNKELLSRRDEKLLRRYYELTEVQNLRFDRALTLLSKDEFFISEDRKSTRLNSSHMPKSRMPSSA